MNEIVPNKQVSFVLNGKPMKGVVMKLGVFNPEYCVVKVDNGTKRGLECWVKIETCTVEE